MHLRDSDVPWAVVVRQLPIPITKDMGRRIMRSSAKYGAMPNDSNTLARINCREGKWPEIDALLYQWYFAVYSLGHRRIPITTALVQEAAYMIAARRSIFGFTASNGYVRGVLKRYDLCNISLHGKAGATNLAAVTAAVEDIRRQLESYPCDRVSNVDETGLLYKCLPFRLYVPHRDGRLARGTKAMRSMNTITLVLLTNATGTQKLAVPMIGSADRPLCFRG